MEYLRIFASSRDCWVDKKPSLSSLLRCFDLISGLAADRPVKKPPSVFHACDRREELQNVAAHFQMTSTTVEKRYAISIKRSDCEKAGVEIKSTRGKTGVSFVDARHSDLTGTPENFFKLMAVLAGRIWEGENRVRVFSAHAIFGQIAVFSQLPGEIDPGAKDRCRTILEKCPPWLSHENRDNVVEISGSIIHKPNDIKVHAMHDLRSNPPADSLFDRIRQWMSSRRK